MMKVASTLPEAFVGTGDLGLELGEGPDDLDLARQSLVLDVIWRRRARLRMLAAFTARRVPK